MPTFYCQKNNHMLKFSKYWQATNIIAKEETDFPEPDSPTIQDFIVLQIITDVLITAE
jgi:hypothetical protein